MSLYCKLLESVVLPAYDKIRSRRTMERRHFLQESQWWSSEQILEFQWAELKKLLQVAFESVPYYRHKYRSAGAALGDIRTWDDFKRLPRLTRDDIRNHRSELCSSAHADKLLPHSTGGSSGVPTRFFRTYESYEWRIAAKDRVYSWAGLPLSGRAAYLWGAPVGAVSTKQRWKGKLHDAVQRQRIFNTFSQTEQLWERVHQEIINFRPLVLVGYISSLEGFADYLQSTRKSLPKLRGVIASAEPLFENVREKLQRAFGTPVFNTYGSREFMSLAGECGEHNGLHVNAENVLVEAGSATETGDILVTDLHNHGMPFIRYEIGDLGTSLSSPCACGRGLPRLRSIEGRVLDSMRTADGRTVPGEFFPHLLKEFAEVKQFRVEQQSLDRIVISAVMTTELSDCNRMLLEAEISRVFGSGTKCRIQRVEEIPLLPSGKRRITIGMAAHCSQ